MFLQTTTTRGGVSPPRRRQPPRRTRWRRARRGSLCSRASRTTSSLSDRPACRTPRARPRSRWSRDDGANVVVAPGGIVPKTEAPEVPPPAQAEVARVTVRRPRLGPGLEELPLFCPWERAPPPRELVRVGDRSIRWCRVEALAEVAAP